MKTLSLILISFCSFFSFSQDQTTWDNENLNGRIYFFSTNTWSFTLDEGTAVKDSVEKNWTCYFDEFGNEINSTYLWGFGAKKIVRNFDYDRDKQMILETLYGNDEIEFKRITFKYARDSRSAVKQEVNQDGTIEQFMCKYNWKKSITRLERFDQKERLKSKETFDYDERNNMIEYRFTKYIGKDSSVLKARVAYEFDTYNSCTKEVYYGDEDQLIYEITYTYDDKGNCIMFEYKDAINSGNSYKEQYQYEFDDLNNWTKKTTVDSDGKVSGIEERTISYYES